MVPFPKTSLNCTVRHQQKSSERIGYELVFGNHGICTVLQHLVDPTSVSCRMMSKFMSGGKSLSATWTMCGDAYPVCLSFIQIQTLQRRNIHELQVQLVFFDQGINVTRFS
jgi:hypothetical protein